MGKCKELLENGKACAMKVVLEADTTKASVIHYGKHGDVSTISWPTKRAGHGMCWYHHNLKRSKEIMERKELERRTLG